MHRALIVTLVLVISGCASLAWNKWDTLYGEKDPERFDHPLPSTTISYQHDVKPILDQRCVVCHSCYDAPCQLKLTAYEGVTRGANKTYIYESSRLLAADPTRLFHDALSTVEWRDKNFFPVLNERRNDPEANIQASVMAQLLLQKQDHPLPDVEVLPDSFDFQLHRNQQCTDIEKYPAYREKYPLWGMPYGLPGLEQKEHDTLLRWLEAGSPYEPPAALSAEQASTIEKWERFLNQDSLKAQLMSRYIYEHLFLAHLYFEENNTPIFFEMVRSRTAAPEPIDLISTRRPYDSPKVERVYYRLRRYQETAVAKTHMPYKLDQQRMDKWQKWFLDPNYTVDTLPDYKIKTASNPFVTFDAIPTYARYRFMLDEAQFTIMGFIKGPVCRGQVALNVINDHFWVAFIHPKYETVELNTDFLEQNANLLKLPARDSSSAGVLNWISYGRNEQKYMEAKARYLNKNVDKNFRISTDLLWDGDGDNPNAALTIYRHFDSATVIKGLHGGKPQTAWVITYPLLERIHYLLVAGFDVFGNVGHQLNTRIYMDFLRMEGEFHFLTALPKAERDKVRQHWYRGSVDRVKEHLLNYSAAYHGETAEEYTTDDPLSELYGKLHRKLEPILDHSHDIDQSEISNTIKQSLRKLDDIEGIAASLMPQTSYLELELDDGTRHYYTILSNSVYTNISHLLDESEHRLPQEDTLSVSKGLLGNYPNIFLKVRGSDLDNLTKSISDMENEKDYIKLLDQYAVRRTSNQFWSFSDRLHQSFQSDEPIEFGYLDYNRFDNK